MTGPAVPPGGEELRKQLLDALARARRSPFGPHVPTLTDYILALPAVREALAAQEKLRRVEELADELDTHGKARLNNGVRASDRGDLAGGGAEMAAAAQIRRALAGDS